VAAGAGIGTTTNAARVIPGCQKRAALVIPYYDPIAGAPMTWSGHDFMRVRYLGNETTGNFVKAKKPQRFAQAKGSPVFAYFPRGTSIRWQDVLPDPAVPLVFTEGEFKALSGCAHDVPVIALGGVDSFANNGTFLPELEAIAWQGRRVIIAYDSDMAQKLAVQAAARRLGWELHKRGAVVHVATLPDAADGTKQGLDDLIAREGAERASALLLQAPELSTFEPTIDTAPHRLIENLEQLDDALAASGLPIFQRSGMVVHVTTDAAPGDSDDVRRAPGAVVIREVTETTCQQLAMHAARFTKWNAKAKCPVHVSCPPELARHYLQKVNGWRLRSLSGVVEAPTIRTDGAVLQTPGYDSTSGLLYLPNATFPPVPEFPTRDDAIAAVAKLRHVVRGFEFASPEAEAVWIAAAMTAVVRRSLPTAPLFAFSAPVMGSGKTLLAALAGIVASGREPAVMSQGHDADEDRKRLTSVLMRGDSVLLIDNAERPIEGDALCAILTSPEWKDRPLGRSEIVSVPTHTTILVTGNNLTFRGDMSTRALLCKLLPKAERPEERRYGWDARAETKALRPDLVAAVLTIIRAYVVVGSPAVQAKPFGRFEQWQRFVHNPLVWLGAPDPLATRELIERNDPERETFAQLLHLWSVVFGERPVRVKDIAALQYVQLTGDAAPKRELYELACEVSDSRIDGAFNTKKFGRYLLAKEERAAGGYRLIKGRDGHSGKVSWRLGRS
jgi:hypothetical protein